MDFLGIRILGLNAETAWKIVLSLVVIGLALAVRAALVVVPGLGTGASRRSTWIRKGIQVGDVRGDVIDISLFKTTVMEMGVPPPLPSQGHNWITARQYTGRVVTVPNAEVFRQPTYNYTRNLDFLWEEMHVPLHFDADLQAAESILLDAAREATAEVVREGRAALEHMRERYAVRAADLEPRVYMQITDNWVELTVRFLVKAFGVRELKDVLSRDVLARFRAQGITIASTTVEIAGLPALNVRLPRGAGRRDDASR